MSDQNGYHAHDGQGGYSSQQPPPLGTSTSQQQHQAIPTAPQQSLPNASAPYHGNTSNGYPSTHQGAYASSSRHTASDAGARPIPGQIPGGMPYDDPRNLPGVYPFITYQPVARSHFSPMTEVFPPDSSSTGLYPQHADLFSQLDSPVTPEDWAMRNAAESRIRAAMAAGTSYSNMYHVPDSSSFDMPTYPPYHPPGLPAPMAYSFLPNYLPPPMPQQPPTPSSNADPQTPSGLELFDAFLASRQPQTPTDDESEMAASSSAAGDHPSSSVTSTPSIARHMSRANLDTASPGPSPSKKQRTAKSERKSASPTPRAKTAPDRGSLKIVIKRENLSQPGLHTPTPSIGASAKRSQPSGSQGSVKREVVVEIPMRGRNGQGEEEEDDTLAWGDEADDEGGQGEEVRGDGDWKMDRARTQSPKWQLRTTDPGSARTGERDTRTSIEKLQQLMEDIFEESDTFPAELTEQDITSARYYDALHPSTTFALLSNKAVEKITNTVNRVQKAMKQSRNQEMDWEAAGLPKLLRILERSLTGLDSLTPFENDKKASAAQKKTKSKKDREKKGSKSPEAAATALHDDGEEAVTAALTSEEVHQKEGVLEAFARAGLAAECCLTLLDTDGLPKHLLSEEILTLAVGHVKNTLAKVLIPIVEALGGCTISSRYLEHVVDLETSLSKRNLGPAFASPSLSSLAQSSWASLPRISSLLARSDISFADDLIIQTVYLAITPLFVNEPGTTKKRGKEVVGVGAGMMKSLRVEALSCLRGVFARYEEQRQWIVEEILSAMGRSSDTATLAKFPLSNGSHIQTVSALLLQLIQASAFGVSRRVRRIRSSFFALSLDVPSAATTPGTPAERLETLDEEIRICAEAIDSAIKSAGIVVKYLVQRSGTSRGNKSSHDTDYKAILDFFVADLLSVLYRPEWPGASVYLTVLSRVLMSALDEPKTGDSSAKSLALDYLGDIAAKLRHFHLDSEATVTTSLDEIIAGANVEACDDLAGKHRLIHDHLTLAARDDAMYSCSLDMAALVWAQELHAAIKKSASVVDKLAQEKDEEAMETRDRLQAVQVSLRRILGAVWSAEDDSVFEISAFGPILGALVATMGVLTIALRSKALKGLSTIVTVDPDVLSNPAVRQAIDDRLSDPSPAVRDAAVELVGRYVVQKPALAADYYPLLALRVSDSGLAVRKRVIKLLRGIFGTTSERDIKVDICCKMVGLTADSDENIKELAVKTAAEMLFPPGAEKAVKEVAAALLVDVVAEFQGGGQVLETGIADIARECEKLGMESRLGEDVDILFEKLSDAMERLDIDPLSHIRAIYLLVLARSDLIDVNKAEGLLLYLKRKPVNVDEQMQNELLLKIFQKCIPAMPRVSSNFAVKLSDDLVPMISSPQGGYSGLKETIACFCAVANHLTRDYVRVMKVLTACEMRNMRNEWVTTGKATSASAPSGGVFLYVCAGIAEGCNLDEVAKTDAAVERGLSKISPDRPLYEHMFEAVLEFTKMPISQQAPSMCFGALFRAYPVLILREEAAAWMDGVFKGHDEATQARLLAVIHDFLNSEAEKKTVKGGAREARAGKVVKQEARGMDALIGNAAELSESGLSTAVVQRNIQHILNGAKSHHPQTQSAAMDILAFTVRNMLYHPIECMSILIALETSENERVAERALDLHHMLHNKHSTLVNVRFLEHTRSSYEYQRTLTAEVVGHRDGTALLQGWYSLLSEKRAWRNDFLKQICRIFDYDISRATASIDVGLTLYICDNLTSLEYKMQEEIMTVVSALVSCVGGATDLVMVLESAEVDGEPGDEIQGKQVNAAKAGEAYTAEAVINASIVVGLAILTKNHLVDVYGIPEEKCAKHVPGKKTAFGDKPAVRRREGMLDTGRMVYVRGVRTVEEFRTQRAAFLEMIHEDGSFEEL